MTISNEAREAAHYEVLSQQAHPDSNQGYHIQQLINSKDERIRELEAEMVGVYTVKKFNTELLHDAQQLSLALTNWRAQRDNIDQRIDLTDALLARHDEFKTKYPKQ